MEGPRASGSERAHISGLQALSSDNGTCCIIRRSLLEPQDGRPGGPVHAVLGSGRAIRCGLMERAGCNWYTLHQPFPFRGEWLPGKGTGFPRHAPSLGTDQGGWRPDRQTTS